MNSWTLWKKQRNGLKAMLERIERGTKDWESLEALWDKWKERLWSHRLDMA